MNLLESQPRLEHLFRALLDHEEEFRALDAAAGDGDLGITVRSAATAMLEWLRECSPETSIKQVLDGLATACATAAPSTFGSLVSRALSAAAGVIDDDATGDVGTLTAGLEAAIANIRRRGRAEPGEKTFLDPLVASLAAAHDATSLDEAIHRMRLAAISSTEESAQTVPVHGRAAWVGERAAGLPDAGSVVVIRTLESLDDGAQPWICPDASTS